MIQEYLIYFHLVSEENTDWAPLKQKSVKLQYKAFNDFTLELYSIAHCFKLNFICQNCFVHLEKIS